MSEQKEQPDPDNKPLSEATIFVKHCAMHYPLGSHSLVSIKGDVVGMSITEHSKPDESYQAWRACNSNKDAKDIYDQMINQLLERDYIMVYRGERNKG